MTASDEGSEEGEEWQQETTQEIDMTVFYRIVAGFTNHVRNSPNPIGALDEIICQYKPMRKRGGEWLAEVHNVLIDSWIDYSDEIQQAMKVPIPLDERPMLMIRDAVEYTLRRGEWPEYCAVPYRPAS